MCDPPAGALAARLRELPLRTGRLKTGTPPRIDGRSIDFDRLTPQPGDDPTPTFSFLGDATRHPRQVLCHVTATNERTHELIRAALHRSPMYGGVIEGVGPRYCPSIEDKVVRFADRDGHQVFVEPEGLDTHELYPNGISTSLPFDVQQALDAADTSATILLQVHDALGRLVRTLVDGDRVRGGHSMRFDAAALPAGIYYARMITGGGARSIRMVPSSW